jgi:hypothetical protein
MEAALHAGSLLAAGLGQPLSENSRPGHQLSTLALYPGIGFINSNTATGLRVCLYDDGRGSRDTGKERDSGRHFVGILGGGPSGKGPDFGQRGDVSPVGQRGDVSPVCEFLRSCPS